MAEELEDIGGIARELVAKLELMAASGVDECLIRRRGLKEINAEVAGCGRCALSRARTFVATGAGTVKSGLFMVVESPFAEAQGAEAYGGEDGRFLKDIITKGLKVDTSDVYLGFLVKCVNDKGASGREGARKEEQEQGAATACLPYLFEEIEALAPKVLLLFGTAVAEHFLGSALGLSPDALSRNRVYRYKGTEVVYTYSLKEIMEDGALKSDFWKGALRHGKIVKAVR